MKTVFNAYCMALLGLVFGLIGLHRFYLGFFNTGVWMAGMFFGGVSCFAIGYAELLTPFLIKFASVGGDLSTLRQNIEPLIAETRNAELLNPESREWFVGGGLMCLASLCWLAVDCITMSELTHKANND